MTGTENLAKCVCSECFAQNSMVAREVSAPTRPQIEHETTETTDPEEIVVIEGNELESSYKCDNCDKLVCD